MALWNDKRTPPGVFTDTRSGQNGSISPSTGSWKNRTDREPTVESTFNQPKTPSWKTRTDREPTIYEKPQKSPSARTQAVANASTSPNTKFSQKASPTRMRAVANASTSKAAGVNPKTTSYLQNIGGATKAVPGVSGVSKSPAKPGTYAPAGGKKPSPPTRGKFKPTKYRPYGP